VYAYAMTIVRNVFDIVPEEVRTAFDGNPHLTMPKLAKAMRMDLKTLGRHREAQNLPVHIKGTGLARRHYVCTLNDVAEFYRRTGEVQGQEVTLLSVRFPNQRSSLLRLDRKQK
jgi:hypothetical protein